MSRSRKIFRHTARRAVVRAWRSPVRPHVRNLPGHRRGPGDLAQALSAFTRAIRCHRRLARLAPSFFDSAVADREARERLERRRWRETVECAIEKVYGPRAASEWRTDAMDDGPTLPGSPTQRAIERELADRGFWLAAGDLAWARHRQRRPHAILSLSQASRLIRIGNDFGRLACGLEPCRPVPSPPSDGPSFEEALARS